MEKIKILVLICVFAVFSGCEEDPDICIEQNSYPVVFAVFNKMDSIHEVILTKSFSGDNGGSLIAASTWDSIYFPEAEISGTFYFENEYGLFADTFKFIKEIRSNREPGIFLNPDYPIYVLKKDISSYFSVLLNIDIPGYNIAPRYTRLLDEPEIILPVRNDYTLEINQDQTLFIRWKSRFSSINEFVLNFVIDTYKNESKQVDTLIYRQLDIRNNFQVGFIQAEFNYLKLLSLLNQKFKSNDVDYRSIRTVNFSCLSSYHLEGVLLPDETNPMGMIASDYKRLDPLTFCFWFVGSRVTATKSDLKIESYSIQEMNRDTAFSKFKISRW